MDERKIILAQMQRLFRFQSLSKNVSSVNSNLYADDRTIGVKSEIIRFNSYIESINSIIEKGEYSIEFIDGSMVNFWYEFDKAGKCVMHSISYMPYYKDVNDEEAEDANIDEYFFCERVSQYLRIDYEEQGRKEFCHSLIHLHMGPGRDSLRIPVDSVIYPNDFMFFVLNYIYGEGIEDKYFEKRAEEDIIRDFLTEAEKERARISFV